MSKLHLKNPSRSPARAETIVSIGLAHKFTASSHSQTHKTSGYGSCSVNPAVEMRRCFLVFF